MKSRKNQPESEMMSYGYDPKTYLGAVKCPIFNTSTFVFETAEEGKRYFELAYGIREAEASEEMGFIYSRINNPNLDIFEKRLALWDKADNCAVFESGMAAITTVLLEFLKKGDLLVYTHPTYGGTNHFIEHFLPKNGIHAIGVHPDQSIDEVKELIIDSGLSDKLAMFYLETPANPTNHLVDIEAFTTLAKQFSSKERKVYTAVDNTFMGPIWQHPLKHGADLVVYSATKYIGGHSDVVAGAVVGNEDVMSRVKVLRTFLGNMASPNTAWLLKRSLETLKIRLDQQAKNAQKVANYLKSHPKVKSISYLGLLDKKSEQYKIYKKQCSAPGAMISFDIIGGEKEAFQFLNALNMVKLAVSLGGTESLIQHPNSMTHIGVAEVEKERMQITDSLVRLSVGIENVDDIIYDLEQAFSKVDLSDRVMHYS